MSHGSSPQASDQTSGVSSAFHDVEGKPTARGFLVLVFHVGAGLAHRFDRLVQGHVMLPVAAYRQPGGGDRLNRGDGVPLDARDLHEAADRVAGSIPISAAFSTWRGEPPSISARPPAAMEQADPTSPWQPTSAPLMEAFSLKRLPIPAATSRKRMTPSSSGAGRKFQ
jgi:hypothetical protein